MRQALRAVWLVRSALFALLVVVGLIGSIFFFDARFDRDQEAKIITAALASAAWLAALEAALRSYRGLPGRSGLLSGRVLTSLALFLTLIYLLAGLASGVQ